MKKILHSCFIFALVFCRINTASAQAYEQGKSQLNLAFGVGSNFLKNSAVSSMVPVGVIYEYGLKEDVSIGAYLGVAQSSLAYSSTGGLWTDKNTHVLLAARASYHLHSENTQLDPYLGILFGYNFVNTSTERPSGYTGSIVAPANTADGFLFGIHLGAHYFFNEHFGAFGELGYGIAWLNLGLTAKY